MRNAHSKHLENSWRSEVETNSLDPRAGEGLWVARSYSSSLCLVEDTELKQQNSFGSQEPRLCDTWWAGTGTIVTHRSVQAGPQLTLFKQLMTPIYLYLFSQELSHILTYSRYQILKPFLRKEGVFQSSEIQLQDSSHWINVPFILIISKGIFTCPENSFHFQHYYRVGLDMWFLASLEETLTFPQTRKPSSVW